MLVAWATLAFPLASKAQQMAPPTNIDIKAAYCMAMDAGVLEKGNELIVQLNKMLIEHGAPDEVRIKAARDAQNQTALLQSEGNRLATYVMGRMLYVDPTMMLLAKQNADQDLKVMFTIGADRQEALANAATARAKDCRDLSWLPF